MQKLLQHYFFFFLLAFCCSISAAPKKAGDKDTTVNINLNLSDFTSGDPAVQAHADSTLRQIKDIDNLLKFVNPWKMKAGDDSLYAAENYDDSNWQEVKDDSIKKQKNEPGSISWYRMHFDIDSSLMNVPLAFYMVQFGAASDVYLDGKFLKSFGKVGKDKQSEVADFSVNPLPFAFTFTAKKNHVLALRYSDFHRENAQGKGLSLGGIFYVEVKPLNEEIADAANPSKYFPFIFFGTIFLTLGVVHFIMFLFLREKKSNFSYSVYCLAISMITFYVYYILTATDFEAVTRFSRMGMYLASAVVMPLISMLHRIFYNKRLKIFTVIVALFGLSLILFFNDKFKAAGIVLFLLFAVSTIEILRVIIRAIVKKKDGAWIFAMVILLAPIAGIISAYLPHEINLGGMKIHNNTGVVVLSSFILGLPFSMTLYLARDFARMSKTLKQQLKEITGLSEQTIRQEKEKKQILENQNVELEKKVTERTMEVITQKNIIEVKNKEITANLTYAKRIQSAILPDIRLIYKALEQSFILYIPKDIVSGDFYGFAQKNSKVLIASADCTGHGVTGAFMSMIGSSLLNQIINERNITSPAQILDSLNEGIVHSLKQKETDSHDGMDISICTFDLQNHRVQFAGANRPLWMIRNNTLLVYEPDKFPIGGMQVVTDEKFNEIEIALEQNDTLYMFTDGFADQFGGENGKKLMSKKFKDILLSIQHLPMSEQGAYLDNHFKMWMGSNEQVDDVLVIGIKV
jgi:serine phosphatase RsbU (regulator of sigma subunit)